MGFSWTGILNVGKRVVSVTKADIDAALEVAGKDANTAIKLFIKVEPVAVTFLTPWAPEAALLVGEAYTVAEKVEADVTAAGATKLQMATGIFTDAIVPATTAGLTAAGKTIDATKLSAIAPDLFNAIVAENNAQAQVNSLLSTAAANKSLPDPASLAAAESAVAAAIAQVKTLGLGIHAAIESIAPASTPATT